MRRIIFSFVFIAFLKTASGQQVRVGKLSPALEQRIARQQKGEGLDSVDLVVQWQKSAALPAQWRSLQRYDPAGVRVVRIHAKELKSLQLQVPLLFADVAKKPTEEVTTGSMDITLNRLNAARYVFPEINGDGINISFKEQHFDTADIDYRGRFFLTGLEAAAATTHASLMATIAAGAGNSAPEARGAAPAARVTSASFSRLLPDPDSVFARYGVAVQNHSYGTAVENYYGPEALAYDQQVKELPQLLHVFSSGNSGTAPGVGTYEGVAAAANLTGNFKYAKNVLTVGALDSFGKVAALSSRGPAFDGRIKPELTAFGADGSSGAAALVSGTAALLQEAFRQTNDTLPPAALLKAVLVNSAFEVGPPGVDHVSGWGGLDGLAALKAIKEQRYAVKEMAAGSVVRLPLTVPTGISRVKITISWSDPPAVINTAKALVNDVDLELRLPATGERWQPWTLHAGREALLLPAIRGVDTLNNTEQVWIDQPQPGNYEVVLSGTRLQTQGQQVALSWQLDTANLLAFTFPVATESVEAGSRILVRWHTTMEGAGSLEYALGSGEWQPLVTLPDLRVSSAAWEVPDTTASARLRLLLPGGASVVSDPFVVSPRPGLSVGFQCADSLLLAWSRADAGNYQLYRLGDRYLEPVATSAGSFAVLKTTGPGIYSVAPLVAGKPGVRSFALNSENAGVGCYFKSFYVQSFENNRLLMQASLGSVYQLRSVRAQKLVGGTYRDITGPLEPLLSFTIADNNLIAGTNFYRLVLTTQRGQEITGEPLTYFYFANLPVQAYPNPVRQGSALTLHSQLPGKYEVEVFDMLGRRLRWVRLMDVTNQLTVQWKPGIYLLRVRSDDGTAGVMRIMVY